MTVGLIICVKSIAEEMELDYVYRSRQSEMAPVADCVWLTEELLVVAFRTGLIEIVDVETRAVVATHKLENKTILSIASVVGSQKIFIQTKADSVSLFQIEDWKCLWTVSTSTAVTFARPTVAGDRVCFVSKGQSVMSMVNIETGYVERQIDLAPTGANGITVAIAVSGDGWQALTESVHVVSVSADGKVDTVIRVPFPSTQESVIPTAFFSRSADSWIVGFSDGSLQELSFATGRKSLESNPLDIPVQGGIGAVTKSASGMVLGGTWQGHIFTLPEVPDQDQPHSSSIVKACCSLVRAAVASTDGRVSVWDLFPSCGGPPVPSYIPSYSNSD